jgi:hypothetical protein
MKRFNTQREMNSLPAIEGIVALENKEDDQESFRKADDMRLRAEFQDPSATLIGLYVKV